MPEQYELPSSELDDRYLKLFRPHLAADKLNRNIRSHRHAESRFRHARDERIGAFAINTRNKLQRKQSQSYLVAWTTWSQTHT